jgi:hypothetical protein
VNIAEKAIVRKMGAEKCSFPIFLTPSFCHSDLRPMTGLKDAAPLHLQTTPTQITTGNSYDPKW